jgi:SAM-dependent methyltransferase
MNAAERALFEAATRPYRAAGRYAWHFARGKLGHDPAFFALLRHWLIGDGARVLDLGCSQCLLAALLLCAPRQFDAGAWPADWPPPPRRLTLHGIDLLPRDVERARRALGDAVAVAAGDIRAAPFPGADVVVILDVLHYLPRDEQTRVLQKVADALSPRGRLLLRVADAGAGARFVCTWLGDRLGTLLRGELWPRHHHRALADWTATLQDLGFRVTRRPMSQGTPFANVLLIADRSD